MNLTKNAISSESDGVTLVVRTLVIGLYVVVGFRVVVVVVVVVVGFNVAVLTDPGRIIAGFINFDSSC